MNFKKTLSFVTLMIIALGIPLQWFALSQGEKAKLTKNVIISQSKLERNLVTGKKYIRAIDRLIEEKKNDEVYLSRLIEKLSDRRSDFANTDSSKAQKIVYIIDYIIAKAQMSIAMMEQKEISDIISDIDENDKDEVRKRMLSLQSNILTESEDILGIIKQYTSYKQSGSYEMNLNIDEDSFGTLMSEFKITDYIAKSNLFDSQLTWDVEWRLEYSIAGQDMKFEFSSFVDAIVKDDNFYVMLDDVVSTVEKENSELKSLIDISKKISTQWKYVRFTSENYGDVEISKEMINNFLSVNKYRSLLENPILETYKVEGDKYYLIPTESFCSEAKKLFGGILGNLGDDGCSESQYNDMVEEFLDGTNAYMTMSGNVSTIYMEEKWGASSMNISFDNDSMLSANAEINQISPYSGESKMTMAYLNGQSLDIILKTPTANASFISKLNNDNSFDSFDMIVEVWDVFEMDMTLQDERLEGGIKISKKEYPTRYTNTITTWATPPEDGILRFNTVDITPTITEIFTADISGTLEREFVDMKVMFEFMDFIKRSDNNYKWTMNLWADTRDNKNNFDMSLNINQSEENIVELDIKSESTIEYWEVQIEAPTDYVEAEEVWNEETFTEIN